MVHVLLPSLFIGCSLYASVFTESATSLLLGDDTAAGLNACVVAQGDVCLSVLVLDDGLLLLVVTDEQQPLLHFFLYVQ